MANYNKVILMGNLTRDPEMRFLPKGTAVAKFGLAVNRRWRSETGEQKEETTFVDIEAFGKQAETISQYLKKGRPVMVEGRLKLDQWDDKQTGQKRSRMSVVLENFQFLDAGGGTGGGGGRGSGGPSEADVDSGSSGGSAPRSDVGSRPSAPEDDDVPF